MFKKRVATKNDSTLAVVRLVLGTVFATHGSQEMPGCFRRTVSRPNAHARPGSVLAMAAEFFLGGGLLAGLFTPIVAFGISAVMPARIFTVHLQCGFFMNGLGNRRGEKIEYHLQALAIPLMIRGAREYSADRALSG